jgi:3-phenylpropionate/trans-cinnamate dioxygenase ferredoxin reductase subunit
MQSPHIVIVGAGLAGLRTAERIRRQDHTGPITLVGAEPHLPYDRPPLSKSLLVAAQQLAPVALRAEEAYAELDLDLRTGATATSLDTKLKELGLTDGVRLGYDRLVIATGARPRRIESFMGLAGVHLLRTWEDCQNLRADLHSSRRGRPPRLTVIGGGVLGCEVVASAGTMGLEAHLVEALTTPLGRVLGDQVGETVARLHREHGVGLHLGTSVASVEGTGHVERVELADGTSIPTDVLVVAVGAAPNTEWLHGSLIAVDDGVVCDATGTTSDVDILAAGDVARMPHVRQPRSVRLEHWTNAVDTAALAGGNVLLDPPQRAALTEVPYFWSDQYGTKIQSLGLAQPDDDLEIVDGSLDEPRFLGLYHRAGAVTGAVAIGRPGLLARSRAAVAAGARLDDVLKNPPWVRR